MGEALRKLKTAAEEVTVDLDVPALVVTRSDLHAFAVHPGSAACDACDPERPGRRGVCEAHYQPELAKARCVRALVHEVVRAATGGQMGRHDGKVYAAWLEALDVVDDGETKVTVTREAVRWLRKHVDADDIKVKAGLVQWREALADYLAELDATRPAEASGMMCPRADASAFPA